MINNENLLEEYSNKCQKLNKIYNVVNNTLYFNDVKSKIFYDFIFEIADILERNDNELGLKYIREE